MKRIFFFLFLQLAVMMAANSQVVPKGMNYQAVARNLKGEIIANQKVSLKINLFGNADNKRNNHYSEIHEVSTNTMGLFNLIIGEGARDLGEYGLIPWNTENIWMEVAIKDKGQGGFAIVSSSKLLAVPYAIHSGTATGLSYKTGNQTSGISPPEPGVVSTIWSVFGNAMTDASGNPYHVNSLGTTDLVDLILITNNEERLKILSTGDIVTKLNFEVGKNLNVGQNLSVGLNTTIGDSLIVKKNVFLNTIGGSTLNFGPFTVANQSPTLLTGQLIVDQAVDLNGTLNVDGATDLNSRLFVNNMSPTKLTGTLEVDSTTNLNDALNVNNMSPTYLSGTLRVDDSATFMDKVKITSLYSTDTSGTMPSGSLQVGGGLYVQKNFFVGGVAKFGGPVAFAGAVSITDGTQSVNPTTGALKISGGVGIGLNLNVGGAATIGGMTTLKDLSQSFNDSTGALKVLGGVGIRKGLNVREAVSFNNTLTVAGITTMDDSLIVKSSSSFVANFKNLTNQNGIRIQLNNSQPGDANHFVEFRNSTGGVVGRIEGENASEYMANPRYQLELQRLSTKVDYAAFLIAGATFREAAAIAYVVAAALSFTFCVGLGACTAAPIISFIVQSVLELASATVSLASTIVVFEAAKARKQDFLTYTSNNIGVTYESGSGDYAEWLPKSNAEEAFLPGQIVGLKYGRITKNLDGASKLMVVSTDPVVLGNMPEKVDGMHYEKVAFLGQVPVYVLGKVNAGDYIIPSGNNDGLGRAVAPDKIIAEDYARVVGVAWSGSTSDAYSLINVAVGMNDGAISKAVVENKNKLEELNTSFNQSDDVLATLLPDYKKAVQKKQVEKLSAQNVIPDGVNLNTGQFRRGGSDLREISSDKVMELMDVADKALKKHGINVDGNPFWDKIKADPRFKDGVIKDVQDAYRKEIEIQLEKFNPRK